MLLVSDVLCIAPPGGGMGKYVEKMAHEFEDCSDESLQNDKKIEKTASKGKSGLIYLSTIPPGFDAREIRRIFSSCGEVGRIYLKKKPEKMNSTKTVKRKNPLRKRKATRYEEGWVEFKKKKVAKQVANFYNGKQIGGKKKSEAFDSIWCIKYLHRFKWDNLNERLAYERALHAQRQRVEIERAKHETEHFVQTVNGVQAEDEVAKFNQRLTSNEIVQKKKKRRLNDGLVTEENPGSKKSLLEYIFA